MKAKFIVNGQEIEFDLPESVVESLGIKKRTGYERVAEGEVSYAVSEYGDIDFYREGDDAYDNKLYEVANYYSDKTVAENNARADKLMRQLRRFAVEHRKKSLNWSDTCQHKNYILYDHERGCIDTDSWVQECDFGTIYFDSKNTADAAIEAFRDELLWYFTEYKDSL